MFKIIHSALRKPITVLVIVFGIGFFSVLSIFRIPVDIIPELNLPTIYIIQPYGGMAPEEMDAFMATKYQDHFLYVTGIKDIDIKTIQGLVRMKLEFFPDTDMAQAAAEVANNIARAKAYMPEGTVPPQVIRFDASSVPVGQLVFQGKSRSLAELQDFANSRIRPMFSKIDGVSSPPPFGGNQRSIVVKVDPKLLSSYKRTPKDVVDAIIANNQPSPAGNLRIGNLTYMTPVNSLVKEPEDFEKIPLRPESGPTVYVGDVATVKDAADITVSYALVNGKRAVYIPVVKKADASTLDVVANIKKAIPSFNDALPEDVKVTFEFDQSSYVTNALRTLVIEGTLGAILTGLMVLLFLRDLRSVVIVVLTIPISLLSAVMLLYFTGETVNIMTLSGLALSVGILVDHATVTIENVHQHFAKNKPKPKAILDACKEIIFPEFLILISILAVFAPAIIMSGVPKSMFLPLSLAVCFAITSSFLLSQTFVPVFANWILKNHTPNEKKESGFNKLKQKYLNLLEKALKWRKLISFFYIILTTGIILICSLIIGTSILPEADSHQFKVRIRAKDGTRVEKTELLTLDVLNIIENITGEENIRISSAFVGNVPATYGTSNIFVFNRGPHEAILQVALRKDYKGEMEELKESIREQAEKQLPGVQLSFEPMDLIDRIMSQGTSAPIEVSVGARKIEVAADFAKKVQKEIKEIPYLRDVQIAQPLSYPVINVNIDRVKAGQLGLTSSEVARSLVVATSSSRFTDKNFWLNYENGLAYQVQVQLPVHEMQSLDDLLSIPLKTGELRPVLGDVASLSKETAPAEYDRSGANRLVTIVANIHDKDLGSARKAVREAIKDAGKPPRGVTVNIVGQTQTLDEIISALQTGLLIAIVFIFLLLTASFQSFKLSLNILSTLPAVIAGSLLMLLFFSSTLNLQSYIGLIMAVGVSVANAILLVTNSEASRHELRDAEKGTIKAASIRVRPILMTTIATISGMLPIALGLGEGGDQVAPLGQAVIGGLIFSTFTSLLVVPCVFSLFQKNVGYTSVSLDPEDPESKFNNTNNSN